MYIAIVSRIVFPLFYIYSGLYYYLLLLVFVEVALTRRGTNGSFTTFASRLHRSKCIEWWRFFLYFKKKKKKKGELKSKPGIHAKCFVHFYGSFHCVLSFRIRILILISFQFFILYGWTCRGYKYKYIYSLLIFLSFFFFLTLNLSLKFPTSVNHFNCTIFRNYFFT